MLTNKVLQIIAPGQTRWEDVAVPTAGPGEVVIRVEGISTCPHWDIRILSGIPMFASRELTYPYTPGEPGHEACGFVHSVGPGVTDFSVDDRIVLWRDPGGRAQGFYARFSVASTDHILLVPKELSVAELAPLELAMCVQVSIDQLNTASAIEGKSVLVGGLGPAGLIAVQLCKAYGATRVTATDLLEQRRLLALELGADEVLDPGELPATHVNSGFDTGLDTTGLAAAIDQIIACTKKVVAVFGVIRERIGFGPERWWGGFTLMGYGEHNRVAANRALDHVIDGRLRLAPLISRSMPLSDYAAGVELLKKKEAIKILFDPWADAPEQALSGTLT